MNEVNIAAQDTSDDCGLLSELVNQILKENDIKFQLNFLRWFNLHSELSIKDDYEEGVLIEKFLNKFNTLMNSEDFLDFDAYKQNYLTKDIVKLMKVMQSKLP